MISTKSKRRSRPNLARSRGSARFDFWGRLKEIDMFFQGNDPVHQTARRAVQRLRRARIRYAIVGGLAVNAHSYKRTTADVDFLLNRRGFERFCEQLVGKFYDRVPGRTRRFVDRKSGVNIDILVTGLYPGTGKPGPIAFPDPADVSETIAGAEVLNLVTLVQLKLAARRHRDFGDVVELIRHNQLDDSFGDKLHSSVRDDFIECLEEKRREDEYEARNG
jgi:hypothetical protein